MSKGRLKYIPRLALDELESIKVETKLPDSEAWRKMAHYSVLGREFESIARLDFLKVKRGRR